VKPVFLLVVTDVFSTEQGIRLGFVKTSEVRGEGVATPPPVRHCRVGTAPFLVRVQKVLASNSVGSVAVVKGGICFSMTFVGKRDSTLKWATIASF
jgi:hypothetical protein